GPASSSASRTRWSRCRADPNSRPSKTSSGSCECFAAFDTLWEERLAEPGDEDLLGLLCRSPGTRGMPRAGLPAHNMVLTVGGNDTTRSTISASVVAFDRYPTELAKLRARLDLIGQSRARTHALADASRSHAKDGDAGCDRRGLPHRTRRQGRDVVSFRKP